MSGSSIQACLLRDLIYLEKPWREKKNRRAGDWIKRTDVQDVCGQCEHPIAQATTDSRTKYLSKRAQNNLFSMGSDSQRGADSSCYAIKYTKIGSWFRSPNSVFGCLLVQIMFCTEKKNFAVLFLSELVQLLVYALRNPGQSLLNPLLCSQLLAGHVVIQNVARSSTAFQLDWLKSHSPVQVTVPVIPNQRNSFGHLGSSSISAKDTTFHHSEHALLSRFGVKVDEKKVLEETEFIFFTLTVHEE
ncbi:hypothetical protein B0H14DRAFT_2645436 [Mycena olivaceomarginata]|nr:hypothetical protein B0H14DRAFT_2645436 [Mycena olivaceomarginata]